jgi:pimeloyl-ACP methyl ester carboxylesterase
VPAAEELRRFRRPVLLVVGEHDPYCPAQDLELLRGAFAEAETAVVAGTDHYLWRREREAAAVVGAFAERAVPA